MEDSLLLGLGVCQRDISVEYIKCIRQVSLHQPFQSLNSHEGEVYFS